MESEREYIRPQNFFLETHPQNFSSAVQLKPEGATMMNECGQHERDAETLRALEPEIIYYGPHRCETCDVMICRVAREQGGIAFNYPEGPIYPNTNWVRHFCAPKQSKIPRRIDINRWTPAELAIREAVLVVEKSGCDPLLTDAVILLTQAREKIADFVDSHPSSSQKVTPWQ